MADMHHLRQLTKKLINEGKLIEAGWIALRIQAIPLDAPPVQLHEMRLAYMAGAQHLFASIIEMLDDSVDETPDDLRRMDLIHKELQDIRNELLMWATRAHGKG